MLNVICSNTNLFMLNEPSAINTIKKIFTNRTGITEGEYYVLVNGKKCNEDTVLYNCNVHIIPKVLGGKGGFGSMLRAIGAQIEKTTNREACRDLSGRRLRDINEEQRLKNWIAQQVEREKEAAQHRQKKLERLCEPPKYEFKDEKYDKERSDLPEKVEDAVAQGLNSASTSQTYGSKRKAQETIVKAKKPKLWFDADIEDDLDDSSSDDSEDGTEGNKKLNVDFEPAVQLPNEEKINANELKEEYKPKLHSPANETPSISS